MRKFFADPRTQEAFEKCKHNPVRGMTNRPAPKPAQPSKMDAKRHTVPVDRKRLNRVLDIDHFEKVIGSGLSAETINAAQLYSEHDTENLRVKLNGSFATAPALMFPFLNHHGGRVKYEVARPSDA